MAKKGRKKIGYCSHKCAGKGKKNTARGKCISVCLGGKKKSKKKSK